MEGAVRARLREFEEFKKEKGPSELRSFREGDWVQFKLSEDEPASHFGSAGTTTTIKLQPRFAYRLKL